MTTPQPVEIRRISSDKQPTGDGICVVWSNGKESTIASAVLRKNCPCATCLEKRGDGSHQAPLSGKSRLQLVFTSAVEGELDLSEVWTVGNYAIGMRWGDDHDTGIYTYDTLYRIAHDVLPEDQSKAKQK